MLNSLISSSIFSENLEIKDFIDAILNQLHEGIIIINKNTRVVFVNKAYSNILGVSKEKVYGKKLAEIEPEADMLKVLETNEPIISSFEKVKSLDIPVCFDAVPININHTIVGAIGVFREAEDIIYLSRELQKANLLNEKLKNELNKQHDCLNSFQEITAVSGLMREALIKANRVASKDTPVLIRGESGTGKELLARSIHNASLRKLGPFVSVNCAAIPETLIESELFGYEKGAFTNANSKGKPGLFEIGEGGTVFLDEIGDMSYNAQSKLLRVLQDHKFKRIGGTQERTANFRLIAATNQSLENLIEAKKFREDLYYRVNVVCITLPPIRKRKSDLRPLIEKLLNEKTDKRKQISEEALDLFHNYDWPGNVRELENVIEHALIMSENELLIQQHHLPDYLHNLGFMNEEKLTYSSAIPWEENANDNTITLPYEENKKLQDYIKSLEKEIIKKELNKRSSKSEAIEKLGLSRRTFYKKIQEYNL